MGILRFADILSNCEKINIPRFVKILAVKTDFDEIKIELRLLRGKAENNEQPEE